MVTMVFLVFLKYFALVWTPVQIVLLLAGFELLHSHYLDISQNFVTYDSFTKLPNINYVTSISALFHLLMKDVPLRNRYLHRCSWMVCDKC